jgi:hypothetical protein
MSTALDVEGDWQVRRVSQTVIEADTYVSKTFPSDPWRTATLGDWKNLLGADFSGTAEYRVLFPYHGAIAEDRFLDLGTVAAAAQVWLNGKRLGACAWQPYRFRTGKALRKGENELRVLVTNTLANYLVSPAVRAAWTAKKGPGWPGPNESPYSYDGRSNGFERQSTTSGLFGPVRLFALGV